MSEGLKDQCRAVAGAIDLFLAYKCSVAPSEKPVKGNNCIYWAKYQAVVKSLTESVSNQEGLLSQGIAFPLQVHADTKSRLAAIQCARAMREGRAFESVSIPDLIKPILTIELYDMGLGKEARKLTGLTQKAARKSIFKVSEDGQPSVILGGKEDAR